MEELSLGRERPPRSRRSTLLLAGAGAAAVLVGAAVVGLPEGSDATGAVPAAASPPSALAAPGATDAGTGEPRRTIGRYPDADPDARTLLKRPAGPGSERLGRIRWRAGELLVSFDCVGAGRLIVRLDGGPTYDVGCEEQAQRWLNGSREDEGGRARVSVRADPGVLWSLRIAQR